MKSKVIILVMIVLGMYLVGFFSSYPYLLEFEKENSSIVDTIRSVFEYSLMFVSFLTFCILFLRKNKWLRFIGIMLLLILVLNFSLSASCFFIYKQGFNVGMMISILETNVSESMSMMKTLALPTMATCIFFILLYVLIYKWGGKIFDSGIRIGIMWRLFAFVWLLLPFVFYLKHQYISNKGGGFMIKNIFYHSVDVQRAFALREEIAKIQNTKVDYQFVHLEDKQPVENIVLLIGESVRKQNMSLYGYTKRETTPIIDKQKNNLLLYRNAYAPAAITNLAVPIILSNIDINNYSREITKLSDNILNVANHLGYDTHWYSTQGGAQGITAIASFAKNKKWINGFDESLVPYLDEALKQPSKRKLIVLHINGSHPYCCDKYPVKEAMWKGGIDECYDNSIRYTDKVIGQILSKLEGTKSVLLYASDHGQIKDGEKYIHGDYREAVQVPYFIWYSNQIDNENKGTDIDAETSTATVYSNILSLMGVENPQMINNSGKFLKLNLVPIEYKDLK